MKKRSGRGNELGRNVVQEAGGCKEIQDTEGVSSLMAGKCFACDEHFETKEDLKHHVKTNHNSFKCLFL